MKTTEPHHDKTCLFQMQTTKAQTTCISVIPIDSFPEISKLSLDSVAGQAGLSLSWSHNSAGRISNGVAQLLMMKMN